MSVTAYECNKASPPSNGSIPGSRSASIESPAAKFDGSEKSTESALPVGGHDVTSGRVDAAPKVRGRRRPCCCRCRRHRRRHRSHRIDPLYRCSIDRRRDVIAPSIAVTGTSTKDESCPKYRAQFLVAQRPYADLVPSDITPGHLI